jgi:hypothetical protein
LGCACRRISGCGLCLLDELLDCRHNDHSITFSEEDRSLRSALRDEGRRTVPAGEAGRTLSSREGTHWSHLSDRGRRAPPLSGFGPRITGASLASAGAASDVHFLSRNWGSMERRKRSETDERSLTKMIP